MSKTIAQYSEIPKVPHFAIFTTRGIYVPGDERSRTNPGHGYPAYTEHALGYEAFDDRAEWEAAVARMKERNQPFSAAYVSPAVVKVNVAVGVDTAERL